MYAYVGNDPLNMRDPSGLDGDENIPVAPPPDGDIDVIVVIGTRGGNPNTPIDWGPSPALTPEYNPGESPMEKLNEEFDKELNKAFEKLCSNITKAIFKGKFGQGLNKLVDNNIKDAVNFLNDHMNSLNASVSTAVSLTGAYGVNSGIMNSKIEVGVFFKSMVETKGDWDIKNNSVYTDQVLTDNQKEATQDAGNFNYGATGTALGFSSFELFIGAQVYSLIDTGGFENQMDAINSGINYQELGCGNK